MTLKTLLTATAVSALVAGAAHVGRTDLGDHVGGNDADYLVKTIFG